MTKKLYLKTSRKYLGEIFNHNKHALCILTSLSCGPFLLVQQFGYFKVLLGCGYDSSVDRTCVTLQASFDTTMHLLIKADIYVGCVQMH